MSGRYDYVPCLLGPVALLPNLRNGQDASLPPYPPPVLPTARQQSCYAPRSHFLFQAAKDAWLQQACNMKVHVIGDTVSHKSRPTTNDTE